MKNTKKLLFNNTYNFGFATIIVTKEKDAFVGVCLEFDLMVRAKSADQAFVEIKDYVEAWIKNINENKLSEELLNKPAPKKYWNLFQASLKRNQERFTTRKGEITSVKPRDIVNFQSTYSNEFNNHCFA